MADPMLVYWVAAVVVGALILWVGTVLARARTRTAPGLDGVGRSTTATKRTADATPARPSTAEPDEGDAKKVDRP